MSEHDNIRRSLEIWQRAAPELERIKWDELRAFDQFRDGHIIDALLDAALTNREERTTSGLVEMRRLLDQAQLRNHSKKLTDE